MTKVPTVLIVDNEEAHRELYRIYLEECSEAPYMVIEAANARDGMMTLIRERPDCVVLDYILGGGDDGFQMLHEIKTYYADCPPILFMTCALTESLRRNVLALGAFECLEKSNTGREEFLRAVAEAVKAREARP